MRSHRLRLPPLAAPVSAGLMAGAFLEVMMVSCRAMPAGIFAMPVRRSGFRGQGYGQKKNGRDKVSHNYVPLVLVEVAPCRKRKLPVSSPQRLGGGKAGAAGRDWFAFQQKPSRGFELRANCGDGEA
jgi:hypothetical protein